MISGGDALAGMYKSEQVFIVLQKTIGRFDGLDRMAPHDYRHTSPPPPINATIVGFEILGRWSSSTCL